MQPYFFPYIGYFQLIAACERFVIYDDVQYITRGWINRNRILVRGNPCYITLPIAKASHLAPIGERYLADSFEQDKRRLLRLFEQEYARAPYFCEVMELFRCCLAYAEPNLFRFLHHCLQRCCHYLDITTPMICSSSLQLDPDLKGQARILAINKSLGADHYINPIGGMELYDRDEFAAEGIRVSFLKARPSPYPHFAASHVPFLSILDVMMFNPVEKIQCMLQEYDLL